MANRQFVQSFFSFFRAPVMIAGHIDLASNAAVSTTTKIKGASVEKTSTGVYTITLEDKYSSLISANVTPMLSATAAIAVEIVSADVTSAKTIVLRTKSTATNNAADVGAATVLYVNLVLGNSSLDV